jgi:hypothetical protein
MSKGSELNLRQKGLNDEDFRKILTKLSNPYRREQRPRKCKRQRIEQGGVTEILANLPTNVWKLDVFDNAGIGDAGMMHLHLIPDTVIHLRLSYCGLSPIGIKRLCKFLKTNETITTMDMGENDLMVAESFKDIADMMKVNNTVNELSILSSQIHDADYCHLSEGLAQNTGLRSLHIRTVNDRLTDEKIQNLCPGLAVNKGLETLHTWDLFVGNSITETGMGYLEMILRTNVYLKNVAFNREYIPTCPGTIQNKMIHWLGLNKCNRKLLKDPNVTPTQWRDSIILSSKYGNPDAIFMYLTNKPEWCML